jgi:sugar transferase (PEP-CTERM/EpsH1 system associated)
MTQAPPLVLHIIHHLVIGGLENGLVNLINHMPESRFRHAIVCIEDFSEFRDRLRRSDVEVYALRRSQIGIWRLRYKLFCLCKRLQPAIVHTRNLSALDALLPARLAGVRCCVHGEHGRNVYDLRGDKKKPALLRRLHAPLVDRYITVSKDLERYLVHRVRIPRTRVSQIYNGVDIDRFSPIATGETALLPPSFIGENNIIIGTVGRIQPVKDHATLAHAFSQLLKTYPEVAGRARLAIVGNGPLLGELRDLVNRLGIAERTWLPGSVHNVPEVFRAFDVFVLPSLAEGISNTILEAMASRLPVLATNVGGNTELVHDGRSGRLFEPKDIKALVNLLAAYCADPSLRRAHGEASRRIAVEQFSLATMVENYQNVYEEVLHHRNVKAHGLITMGRKGN